MDDPSCIHPSLAIFTRDRPACALVAPDLGAFEALPRWRDLGLEFVTIENAVSAPAS